ncbi:MAG: DNA repair protein RadA [Planctomycetota bacterium]|nr:DNA repair protein RadA [Planctomycetota bacterium]
MSKTKVVYACQQCGRQQTKWSGRCPDCGEWNTLAEEVLQAKGAQPTASLGADVPRPIGTIGGDAAPRIACGLAELDRILGGGVVVGSVTLLGGDPGIGKSTLLLQFANLVAQAGHKVLYVTAEESALQIKLRADRLGAGSDRLYLLCETGLESIKTHVEKLKPSFVIVDSIQTLASPEIPSAAGSVSQVRECASQLMYLAKRGGVCLFLIGHVTKDGSLAGPRTLEHLVDTVLYFEGDRYQSYRIIRAVKNRFGSTNEVGIFEMTGTGLSEVKNPSAYLLGQGGRGIPGTVVIPALVGTRSLLVEVQALTTKTSYGVPTRRVSGADFNRVCMLLAVLEKRVGLHLGIHDVFVNVVGGIFVDEPTADLGIAVAIASSFRDRATPPRTVFVGEVGLGGEVRGGAQLASRLQEAARMGFEKAILAADCLKGLDVLPRGIEAVEVKTVAQTLDLVL